MKPQVQLKERSSQMEVPLYAAMFQRSHVDIQVAKEKCEQLPDALVFVQLLTDVARPVTLTVLPWHCLLMRSRQPRQTCL